MTKKVALSTKPKDIEPSISLGNYLQNERQKKKLSIQEVSLATKISQESLIALEAGDKQQLPVAVFTKGFVKIYSRYLGLDQNDALKRFQIEWDTGSETPEMLHEVALAQTSPFYMSGQFYIAILVFFLLLGLAYFFLNANNLGKHDVSLNTIREIQSLPKDITRNKEPISIAKTSATQKTISSPLISLQSAGKIKKEVDEDVILATLPSVVIVQKRVTPSVLTTTPPSAIKNIEKTTAQAVTPEDEIAEILPEDIDDISPSLVLPLDLHISFLARTRISISQDDESPAKYIFSSGEESTWSADKTISMLVEQAENIRVTLNGKHIPLPKSTKGTPLAITIPTDLQNF